MIEYIHVERFVRLRRAGGAVARMATAVAAAGRKRLRLQKEGSA